MDYSEALSRLGELRDIFGKLRGRKKAPSDQSPVLSDEGKILYGELEEIILGVTGVRKVEVEVGHGHKAVFSNYIEAALFSSRTFYNYEGYNQLLKVYGRIQRLVQDPIVPQPEQLLLTWSKYLEDIESAVSISANRRKTKRLSRISYGLCSGLNSTEWNEKRHFKNSETRAIDLILGYQIFGL